MDRARERRTREINPRTYDDRKGTPDVKQCDSERSKSFHGGETDGYGVC